MRRLSSSECRLLALSVMRRTAIYLDAIGGIADIGRRWREMVMTLMTQSGPMAVPLNALRIRNMSRFVAQPFIGFLC